MALQSASWSVKRSFEIRSYVKIQADFVHVFKTEKTLGKKRIESWVTKFEEFGTLQNLNKKSENRRSHSGRKRLGDEVLIDRIRADVENSPKGALGRGPHLGIKRGTLLNVLKYYMGSIPIIYRQSRSSPLMI